MPRFLPSSVPAAALAAGVLLTLPGSSLAVVVSDAAPWALPSASMHVGTILGGTGVAIGRDWVITASHLSPSLNSVFALGAETYAAVEVRPYHSADVTLLRLDRALPEYHDLAPRPLPFQPVVLAGWGVTRGEPVEGGFAWNGTQELTVGVNRVEALGVRYGVRFDAPDSSNFVPGEAQFSLGDSGAALFTIGSTGELLLAGIAVTITGDFASTRSGDWGYTVNLDNLRGWITAIVHPGEPATSSVPAPRPSPPTPSPSSGLAVLAFIGVAASHRRRAA